MKNENYTPLKYIEMSRKVLGSISLDPFSCQKANELVKAERFFDIEMDAFSQSWECKTMFMNPPYSGGLFKPVIKKFIEELQNIGHAIVLTNNNLETESGQLLLKHCSSICILNHRISFLDENFMIQKGNRYAQVFFLFTHPFSLKKRKFKKEFSKIGKVF